MASCWRQSRQVEAGGGGRSGKERGSGGVELRGFLFGQLGSLTSKPKGLGDTTESRDFDPRSANSSIYYFPLLGAESIKAQKGKHSRGYCV